MNYDRTVSPDHIYWLYDPEGDGMMFFATEQERDDAAHDVIRDGYLDDCWSEEVTAVCAGVVTHIATETNRIDKPPASELNEDSEDEEGNYWPPDWDYQCDYELISVGGKK